MPGEENQPQAELVVFDLAAKKGTKLPTDLFKDQQLGLVTAPPTNLQREKQDTAPRWVTMTGDQIYFTRTSRDLKRIDIVNLDVVTGEPRVAVQERSNTYIEIQPLRVLGGGKELIEWSERDGWGHYYLYGARRQDEAADHVGRVRRARASSRSTRRRARSTSTPRAARPARIRTSRTSTA